MMATGKAQNVHKLLLNIEFEWSKNSSRLSPENGSLCLPLFKNKH